MPALTPDRSPIIRFGVYELDLRAQRLTRRGTRVRLSWQSYLVLIALLERPGELVTRAELQKTLWPDGTFVDFEGGLNAAVRRLRVVLSDKAARPTFIETLSRRGYRFAAPVSYCPDGETPAPVTEPPRRVAAPKSSDRRLVFLALAAAVLLFALVAGAGAFASAPWLLTSHFR